MTQPGPSPDSERTITVALVGDNRISRDAHARQIEAAPDLTVVSAEATLTEGMLNDKQPDVVLVEANTESLVSVRDAVTTRRVLPDASVVITDLGPANEEIASFVKAGVAGFVLKEATVTELVDTVREVVDGDHVLPDALTNPLFLQIAREGIDVDGVEARAPTDTLAGVGLTTREREIVTCLGKGMSNKEIAATLHITTHTVKAHMRNVMQKSGLHSRVQLAMRAKSFGDG